jgi:predicted LPLAT superfamily acyltransferase
MWRPSRHEQIHFLGKTTRLDRTLNILARRLDAPIVVGLMHRRQNHHYCFTVASRAEIEKNVTATTPMSIGAMVLKHLERYIYNNPAGWYQWKKYPSIVPIASSVDAAARRPETVLLDTAVGEAALR